jgi:hypothetical protein
VLPCHWFVAGGEGSMPSVGGRGRGGSRGPSRGGGRHGDNDDIDYGDDNDVRSIGYVPWSKIAMRLPCCWDDLLVCSKIAMFL